MIKLYDCTTAPSPRRTRMFLAEKGIDYENIQVDLTKGEQMGEAFRNRANPRARRARRDETRLVLQDDEPSAFRP